MNLITQYFYGSCSTGTSPYAIQAIHPPTISSILNKTLRNFLIHFNVAKVDQFSFSQPHNTINNLNFCLVFSLQNILSLNLITLFLFVLINKFKNLSRIANGVKELNCLTVIAVFSVRFYYWLLIGWNMQSSLKLEKHNLIPPRRHFVGQICLFNGQLESMASVKNIWKNYFFNCCLFFLLNFFFRGIKQLIIIEATRKMQINR